MCSPILLYKKKLTPKTLKYMWRVEDELKSHSLRKEAALKSDGSAADVLVSLARRQHGQPAGYLFINSL